MKTNEKFQTELLFYSIANDYIEATEEWELIYSEDKEGFCICGHDIKKIYYIQNKYNKTILPVGKDCINNFLGDKINSDLKIIQKEAADINREYRFIHTLSYHGMIFDKAYIKKLEYYLTPDEIKLLSNYAKYGAEKWGGVGIIEWEKSFLKTGNHFYMTELLKKLCNHWRARKLSFRYSTLIQNGNTLTEDQYDHANYYREINIKKIKKNR